MGWDEGPVSEYVAIPALISALGPGPGIIQQKVWCPSSLAAWS
jgi:hypothetical protein